MALRPASFVFCVGVEGVRAQSSPGRCPDRARRRPIGGSSGAARCLVPRDARRDAPACGARRGLVLQPKRIDRLVPLAKLSIAHIFQPSDKLPDLAETPDAGELVGIADDLSAATLEEAYERGLFPHAHFGPTKWLSPPERCVLFFEDFHISKRLRRFMRQGDYTVTFDRDFEGVIKACAGKREGRWHLTWITPRIIRAFTALRDAGVAHSFEAVSYTHLRAHETVLDLVCRLLLEKTK